ncbi:MAG: prepilin-type N-terminal cleavage/methylation domain-containing protein [Vicinamibacteria bacterium]|nr:prepilin-type N-terminal cleavage/methylation domain-containing protein [Vicinamibacteria bacterium]
MSNSRQSQAGFSLLELMVALGVTLIITGAMYGLIASSQGAFRREPALVDRQQQIRIAMGRIEEDVLNAGLGLGTFVQAFGENLNGVGMLGVRVAGDPNLGGGNSDFLEIRQQTADCPQVRIDPANPRNGANYNSAETWPSCYPEPGWVLAFFPDGNAKWGWGHNQHGSGAQKFNFPPGQQPAGSQMQGVANLQCSLDLAVVGACPAANQGEAIFFAQMDRIRYQLGNDADGAPSLFRSASGGFDGTTEAFSNPPGNAWQLVARGIEDMQIRYRSFAGWQDAAPVVIPNAAAPFDNIVREVEVTLWARTLGEARLQGQTVAAGNGVTAVRGSLVTSIAPRAAQIALMQETNAAKRWQ